ncbi:MAG TPA: hypothetical protein VMD30_06815, partial [Tepidisphaeraceae bacterium]|nr:hypothetical protein [Tepidisphaeraceae bacterium]
MVALTRRVVCWGLLIGLGLVLLHGRFDWRGGPEVFTGSWHGYLTSAFFFAFTFPTFYFTAGLFIANRRIVAWLTAVYALICVMPYHWLGVDRLAIFSNHFSPVYFSHAGPPAPQLDWLPQSLLHFPAVPWEGWFFGTLLIGAIGLFLVLSGGKPRRWVSDHPAGAVAFAVFGLILLQTWLHLSMRSPYTYLARFEVKPDVRNGKVIWLDHTWHHYYLYPNHQGAVEGDHYVFRACEGLFQGTPGSVNTQQVRRCAVCYWSSQFTFFFNPLYVFLALNMALWLAAAMCGYQFA